MKKNLFIAISYILAGAVFGVGFYYYPIPFGLLCTAIFSGLFWSHAMKLK